MTATTLKTQAINDDAITVAKIAEEAWTAFTPALTASVTNPNIGSTGTIVGSYYKIGKTVFWNVLVSINGTGISAGSGTYAISMPFTPAKSYPITGYGWSYNGSFHMLVVEGGSRIFCTDNNAQMSNDSANGGIVSVSNYISLNGTYEAA